MFRIEYSMLLFRGIQSILFVVYFKITYYLITNERVSRFRKSLLSLTSINMFVIISFSGRLFTWLLCVQQWIMRARGIPLWRRERLQGKWGRAELRWARVAHSQKPWLFIHDIPSKSSSEVSVTMWLYPILESQSMLIPRVNDVGTSSVETSFEFLPWQKRVWMTRFSAPRVGVSRPSCAATASQNATAARTRGSVVSMTSTMFFFWNFWGSDVHDIEEKKKSFSFSLVECILELYMHANQHILG